MLNHIKQQIRDWLPARYQVPVKYYYARLAKHLEEEMRLLPLLVRPGGRVADVGGNRGVYAYWLWRMGAAVEIFEPNTACAAVLAAWAAGRPQVHVHPVALSDHEGSACLHIPVDERGVEHDASASLEHDSGAGSRERQVPLRTLDSFGFEDLCFIKIDVEGHELAVLNGAVSTLARSLPALLVEIEQRHHEEPIGVIFASMARLGYLGWFLRHGRLTALDQFDVACDQSMDRFGGRKADYINNFLFLHRSKVQSGDYGKLLSGAAWG